MWSPKWFLCLSMGVISVVYFSEKAEELQGKVLCGGHFLIWQNLPEYAQDWLEITLLWLFFIVLMYVSVKLAGESGESNVQTPPSHQGDSSGSPGKKKKKASPDKDYMFDTLTLLEMDLVKFLSKVHNLKLAMATGDPPNVEVPADTHSNITVYELWGNEDSD